MNPLLLRRGVPLFSDASEPIALVLTDFSIVIVATFCVRSLVGSRLIEDTSRFRVTREVFECFALFFFIMVKFIG